MIDIREIQVGDYLQNTNGNIGRVIGIRPYMGTAPSMKYDYEVIMQYHQAGTVFSDPKMLQPIKIDGKILEKNGFKRTELCYEYRERLGGYMGQAVSSTTPAEIIYTDEGHCIVSNPHIGRVFQGSVDQVHELQHIIKSCELSKEITL